MELLVHDAAIDHDRRPSVLHHQAELTPFGGLEKLGPSEQIRHLLRP